MSCRNAAELFERHQARARIRLTVLEQLVSPVRPNSDRVELEGEARGVELRIEVTSFLCAFYRAGDRTDPFVHDRGNTVAHDSKSAIELERSSGKKASALENSFFDKN